jgi:hypothetical protein
MVKLQMSRRRKIIIAALFIAAIVITGFLLWAETALGPMPEALSALQSSSKVHVSTEHWIAFEPTGLQKSVGFIFYPGGRVDERSYAPMCRSLAETGYLAVIVPMPLNLAIFGVDKASEVMAAYPQVQSWVIGGHSLGGTMAASYAHSHPSKIKGLALYASYPSSGDNMTNQNIFVISIYGTRDGLVTSGNINDSRLLLPSNTLWVPIEGGNHAQMGWYGPQPGDNDATISRTNQQLQVVTATIGFLEFVGAH